MSSIKVNPSGLPNAVNVSVDTVDGLVYPEYKIVYSLEGEAPVHVSTSDPMPVSIYSSNGSLVDFDYTQHNIELSSTLNKIKRLMEFQNIVLQEAFNLHDLEMGDINE